MRNSLIPKKERNSLLGKAKLSVYKNGGKIICRNWVKETLLFLLVLPLFLHGSYYWTFGGEPDGE
jgi:hypothetical protein